MNIIMKKIINHYKKEISIVAILLLSYVTGISISMLRDYPVTRIEWIVPCLILFAGVVYHKAYSLLEKSQDEGSGISMIKECRYAFGAGFLFALTVVVGSKIDMDERVFLSVGFSDIAIYPFIGLFFSALFAILFSVSDSLLMQAGKKEHMISDTNSKKMSGGNRFISFVKSHPVFCLFLFYAVCYLPYFLTFFPGNCGNDTWESLNMIEGNIPWTNHQPVLFTGAMYLIRKLTVFLPMTASVAVFSFLQMLAMAGTLAYVTGRIFKKDTFIYIKWFAILFFAFHPFVGMYSVYLTKDVYFSLIMLLLSMKIYDIVEKKGEPLGKPKECVILSVLFLLSSMLRNNGIYIAVVMAILFLLLYKKYRKQILMVFVCAIGLFQIWQGPVFSAWNIEKQSFAEAASVPLQQVGYVLYQDKTFSEEDMAFLETLMPVEKVKEVFTPGFTDPYKFDEAFDEAFLNENVGEFLSVWWNGCKQHFGSYVEAYLMQTCGYWHYGETNSVCTQGCTENHLDVEQIDVIKNVTGISLEPIFEKLVLAGRKAPILCMLGSMAIQMLMVGLLTLQYIRRKNGKQIIWLIPLWILWGTLMLATPAFCLLRYLFPVFLLIPYLIADFFDLYYNMRK